VERWKTGVILCLKLHLIYQPLRDSVRTNGERKDWRKRGPTGGKGQSDRSRRLGSMPLVGRVSLNLCGRSRAVALVPPEPDIR